METKARSCSNTHQDNFVLSHSMHITQPKAYREGSRRRILYYEAYEGDQCTHLVADRHFLVYLAKRTKTPHLAKTFDSVEERDLYAERHWQILTETGDHRDADDGNIDAVAPTIEHVNHTVFQTR